MSEKNKSVFPSQWSSGICQRNLFTAFAIAGILSGKDQGSTLVVKDVVDKAIDIADKAIKKLDATAD